MHTRSRARRFATLGTSAGLVATLGLLVPLAGTSGASATVNLTPSQSSYTDQQEVTVTGSGFSTQPTDTVNVVECSDPGGTTANLPKTYSQCDGTTLDDFSGSGASTNSGGTTNQEYLINELSTAGFNGYTSNIDCDATHYCVIWVGEDPVQNFSGTTAQPVGFSQPFLVGSATTGTPESPLTIALPLVGASVAGAGGFLVFRRRRNRAAAA